MKGENKKDIKKGFIVYVWNHFKRAQFKK